jgi:hypothetical protein
MISERILLLQVKDDVLGSEYRSVPERESFKYEDSRECH